MPAGEASAAVVILLSLEETWRADIRQTRATFDDVLTCLVGVDGTQVRMRRADGGTGGGLSTIGTEQIEVVVRLGLE